jgi:hypothetical protein
MRKHGYACAIVEHWNSWAKIRQDLFGIIDILCIHPETGHVVGVQTTSYSNVSSHVTKIHASPNLAVVHRAGWEILVHGWRKVPKKKGGKQMVWTFREVRVMYQNQRQEPPEPPHDHESETHTPQPTPC